MKQATVLRHLIEPINDREIESAFWLYEKVISVMKSCTTVRQLTIADNWAGRVMRYLCSNYSELYSKQHDLFWELYDKLAKQSNEEDKK